MYTIVGEHRVLAMMTAPDHQWLVEKYDAGWKEIMDPTMFASESEVKVFAPIFAALILVFESQHGAVYDRLDLETEEPASYTEHRMIIASTNFDD